MKKRQYTAKMTPWDRRTESHEARQKRHEAQIEEELREMEEKRKEKENGVEQFLISGRLLREGCSMNLPLRSVIPVPRDIFSIVIFTRIGFLNIPGHF